MCDHGPVTTETVLPSGTFLFTDVEGSTRLWAADPDAMSASLRAHKSIVRDAIESRGGYVFTTAGNSFAAAFARASDAVAAAEAMSTSAATASNEVFTVIDHQYQLSLRQCVNH